MLARVENDELGFAILELASHDKACLAPADDDSGCAIW
jgi:hypothetical protein